MSMTIVNRGITQCEDAAGGVEQGDAGSAAVAGSPAGLAATARARAALQVDRTSAAPPSAGAYQMMPAATANVLRPKAIAVPSQGYALVSTTQSTAAAAKSTSTTTTKKSTSTKSTTTATSKSATPTSRELAFLDDKKLSIEEKLFRFMALMTKKSDQELVDAMKAFGGKSTTASTSSSSTGSTSTKPAGTVKPAPAKPAPTANADDPNRPLKEMSPEELMARGYDPVQLVAIYHDRDPNGLDLTSAVSRAADAAVDVGKAVAPLVVSAAKELSGPALAAAVTALGAPELAPVALKVGGALGGLIPSGGASQALTTSTSGATAASSSSGSSSASSSAASTSGTDTTDEKLEMMNLQRLVEKQSAMFTALSNVLKSIHDAQMTAVQNIR